MRLIAHRGLWSDTVLKNSYEALKKGLESPKYVGVECDIRQTLDKVFIIYHDPLYKGNLVKNIYYKDIKDDVCKLEDLLKIKSNKILLLEIKDFDLDTVKFLNLLNKYNRCIYIMSFDYGIMKKIKAKKTNYKLGVLNYVLNSKSDYDLDFICILDVVKTPEIIANFESKGIEVIIYGTINPTKNLTYIVDDIKINIKNP